MTTKLHCGHIKRGECKNCVYTRKQNEAWNDGDICLHTGRHIGECGCCV